MRVDASMSKIFSMLNMLPDRKNFYFLLVTLLIIASTAPLLINSVNAPTPIQGDYPEVPGGIPENTVQYNKTDVSPVGETEQVKADEPALFH